MILFFIDEDTIIAEYTRGRSLITIPSTRNNRTTGRLRSAPTPDNEPVNSESVSEVVTRAFAVNKFSPLDESELFRRFNGHFVCL
jgi:hypothetical protein